MICLYVPYSALSKYRERMAALTRASAKELKLLVVSQIAWLKLLVPV